jgi:hypothetical protein
VSTQALSIAIMRVRPTDEADAPDLMRYLRSTECAGDQVGNDELSVVVPRAPSDDQARRELDVYLRAWQAVHPTVHAEIVG